jgi:hypothetical protein
MNIKDVQLAAHSQGCIVCGRRINPATRRCIVWNGTTGELKTESEGLRDESTDAVAFIGPECAKKFGKYIRSTW